MDTAKLKADLYNIIEGTDDIYTLYKFKLFFENQNKEIKTDEIDFWDDLPDVIKTEIEEGLKDIENGNVISHEEVQKEMKEKYNIEI